MACRPLRPRPSTPSASRLGPSSRFQNQIRNRVRLRYERDVTRLDLDRFRPHALCHEAFEIGVDGPILRGDGIPAWLRPPCRVSVLPVSKALWNGHWTAQSTFAFASG